MIRGLKRMGLMVMLLASGGAVCAAAPLQKSGKDAASGEKSPTQKRIETLQHRKQEIEQKEKLEPVLQDVSQQIETVKQRLEESDNGTSTFYNMKLYALNQKYEAVKNLSQTRRRIIGIIDEHIQTLQSIQESQGKSAAAEQQMSTVTTYETLREYAQKVHDAEQELASLKNTKTRLTGEREQSKQLLNQIEEKYKETRQQQTAVMEQTESNVQVLGQQLQQLPVHQRGEVIDVQLDQFWYQQKLAQARVEENELHVALVTTQIDQNENKVKRLKSRYAQAKERLHIEREYVEKVEAQLQKKRQESVAEQRKLNEQLRRTTAPREEQLNNKIKEIAQEQDLSSEELDAYRKWNKQPESQEQWRVFADVSTVIAELQHVQEQRQWLNAQIEREDITLQREQISYDILSTWYHMTNPLQRNEGRQSLQRDLEQYSTRKARLNTQLQRLKEKHNDAINRLSRSLEALTYLQETAQEQARDVFTQQQNYNAVKTQLARAETHLRKQVDVTTKLMEIYATSKATLEESIARLNDIIAELKSRTMLKRSEQSISWRDFQRFYANVTRFVGELQDDVLQSITQVDVTYLVNSLLVTMKVPYQAIMLIIQIALLIIGYIVLSRYIPSIADFLMARESEFGVINIISALAVVMLRFTRRHLASLYLWIVLFGCIVYEVIPTVQAEVIFYLGSIVYGVYIAYAFFSYFLRVNRERGYLFIGQDYQSRFYWIVPPLVYATIALTCFRQAFWIYGYYDYKVLLAINFILLQISLICLISREQVLSLISGKTPMWEWIESHVSRYYYGLLLGLIAIIVMSNPFVGLGYYVAYYVSRFIMTLLLIPIFSWLHDHIKRATSDLFFYYSEGEVIKERFSAGKSWYGLFVLVSFSTFVLFGLIITAYIWGYDITINSVSEWFNTTIYVAGRDAAGNEITVTIYSIFQVIIFILGGIFLTYIINRFVLQRIFDPLLVGAGVQNTILTLTRYAIIILAALFGFQSAGLEDLGWSLVLLIGGIAYIMKEPLGDVISYFIILVQRPIKVGDFIRMEPNIFGTVRQINPRSTIVRYRNSSSFVVPNSDVITKAVQNWHYTRTFSAFDDIWLTVPYDVDPDYIRDIIFEVLNENINVLRSPRPVVRLENFVENGFEFRIRGFITADKIPDLYEISSQVRLAIVRRLRSEGISIAVPTRVLKVTSRLSQQQTQPQEAPAAHEEQQKQEE